RRLGPSGFHDGRGGSPAAPRVQHDPRHDRSQSGADGRARRRYGFRHARLASARNQLHARCGHEEASVIISRPKNRRKQPDKSSRFWAGWSVDWRRWGVTLASLAGLAAAIGVVLWTLDQPIEAVSVAGRFQRVSPADVERAVKERVKNVGLVSVDLAAVRRAIAGIAWVDTVTVQRAWPHGLRVVVSEQVAAAR